MVFRFRQGLSVLVLVAALAVLIGLGGNALAQAPSLSQRLDNATGQVARLVADLANLAAQQDAYIADLKKENDAMKVEIAALKKPRPE